jgi:exodeoxyribonuclease V alpha subunit
MFQPGRPPQSGKLVVGAHTEVFQVRVDRVLSQLDRGCIFDATLRDGRSLRVKFAGTDVQPEPGDEFEVKGLMSTYLGRFGHKLDQLESKQMRRMPSHGVLLRPFLERLPHIGPTRAQRLLDHYGHTLAEVLGQGKSDAQIVKDLARVLEPSKPALAARMALHILAAFASEEGAFELKSAEVRFLAALEELGLKDHRVANQAWRMVAGVDALQRLQRHPYLLAPLLKWSQADLLGKRLLEQADPDQDTREHPQRLGGAVQSAWIDVLGQGHTAMPLERFQALLEQKKVAAGPALQLAHDLRLVRLAGGLLRVPGAAWQEDQVLAAIWARENRPLTIQTPTQLDECVGLAYQAETQAGLNLTPEQREAVARLLMSPVGALQGGAGVGKTTVVKVLAEAWECLGGNIVACAVAGKAALALARGASSPSRPRLAYTVARIIGMLERKQATEAADAADAAESPNAKRSKPLQGDVEFNNKTLLLLDEAGMLDIPSLHRLLCLLPESARLLFVGDVGQLPPVGPGAFFRDLVEEGSRVVSLTKVMRQASGSSIPHMAAQIRDGQVPQLEAWAGQSEGVYTVARDQLLGVGREIRSKGDALVVAALRKTVNMLNESEAAARRSVGVDDVRIAPAAWVAAGDPVVFNQNRYTDGLFNGLLGVVSSVDADKLMVHWDGEDSPREVPAEAWLDVELAYGITCHKAQGSAADAVLVAVEKSPMVTREWVYTAVTRARKLVLLASDEAELAEAIGRRTERWTGLQIHARPPAVE